MIKPTIKIEGLDKLEGELRKEADKIIEAELRKQKANQQIDEDDSDPINPKSDIGRIDSALRVDSTPRITSSPTISSSRRKP